VGTVQGAGSKSVLTALALTIAIAVADCWTPSGPAIAVLYVIPVLLVARWAQPWSAMWMAGLASGLSVLNLFQTTGEPPMWADMGELVPAFLGLWAAAILTPPRRENKTDGSAVAPDVEEQVLRRTKDLAQANKDLEALRAEAVSLLAALVKSSDDAIIGMSLAGTVRSWNAGAERVYGYAPHEIIGLPITDLCPSDRLDELPAMLNRIAKGEHVRNVETIQRRKRGRRFNVSLTVSPVKDANGNVVAASAIARDITQRKRIEAALRESEARFHMMADTAPVMVWMADPEQGCTFFNKRWLEFTGRTLEQEVGSGWISGIHAQDQLRCRDTYHEAIRQQHPFTMEYRLRRADGTYRWIVDTGVPRFEPDGTLSGYIGSCIDLTERKEMEDELRKTLKEKESLLREVHHRVKNNLQVISSLLNLQMATIKDAQVAQLFKECQVRISSIALLHDTLHRSNDLSSINMPEYLRTLTGHVCRSYGVDPSHLTLELAVEDIAFDVDTGLTCGLIVDELVSNCLKHAFPKGRPGRVTVELRTEKDEWSLLRVSDDGVGFPLDGVLNNPDSLGLELVSLMADKLDGTVSLQSGRGTEWHVRFRPTRYQERM
jgi:PAS domain S-box-containing protein